MHRANTNPHRGFALLLTLVLVLIAGVSLVALARQSTGEALQAVEAAESLQRKWAVASCRRTILERAGKVMDAANTSYAINNAGERALIFDEPIVHHWVSCSLAGIDYDLVVTDEQAKFNPTEMQLKVGKNKTAQTLRRLIQAGLSKHSDPVEVVLRPMQEGLNDGDPTTSINLSKPDRIDVYRHYGQIFDNTSPQVLLGTRERPGPASLVTLWGDDKLRFNRASSVVFRETLKPLIGSEGVEEMSGAINRLGLNDAMQSLQAFDPEDRASMFMASRMLTTKSNKHGLWVVARGETRSWYTLSVRAKPIAQGPNKAAADPNVSVSQPSPAGTAASSDEAIRRIETNRSGSDKKNTVSAGEADSGIEPKLKERYLRYDFAW